MIDAQRVDEVFRDCLYAEHEIPEDGSVPDEAVLVEGVTTNYGFNPVFLEQYRDEIRDWLAQLPTEFRMDGGGGWTFLNACVTADGQQWGEHRNVEQLLCLGIGLGLAKWLLPRAVWKALPGGMPYVGINLGEEED